MIDNVIEPGIIKAIEKELEAASLIDTLNKIPSKPNQAPNQPPNQNQGA